MSAKLTALTAAAAIRMRTPSDRLPQEQQRMRALRAEYKS
jgi:hypothetical protein